MTTEAVNRPRVLVAGIGNIFLGDDAFGVEVAQRLARRRQLDSVRVIDFGIRGLDLAYALLDGYETVILVDATPRGGQPGTLYVLELDLQSAGPVNADLQMETHNLDPVKVLRLAAALGAKVQSLLLVGCEPEPVDDIEEMQSSMSQAVRAAIDEAVLLVESLVADEKFKREFSQG